MPFLQDWPLQLPAYPIMMYVAAVLIESTSNHLDLTRPKTPFAYGMKHGAAVEHPRTSYCTGKVGHTFPDFDVRSLFKTAIKSRGHKVVQPLAARHSRSRVACLCVHVQGLNWWEAVSSRNEWSWPTTLDWLPLSEPRIDTRRAPQSQADSGKLLILVLMVTLSLFHTYVHRISPA